MTHTRFTLRPAATAGMLSLLAFALCTMLVTRAGFSITAQTTPAQSNSGEAGAQLAVDTINNCNLQEPPVGERQEMALFQRAIYTLWSQILLSDSEEKGIANTQILAVVFCRQEQTLGSTVPSDTLSMLHSTHVTTVAYLAGWSLEESVSARPYILQELQKLLGEEVQIMAAIRAAPR
jgi:hypothetical protein